MSQTINTTFYDNLIVALEQAFAKMQLDINDDITRDIFRAACVKYFELILEQSNKLLRKRLKPYFSAAQEADKLVYKDLFRYAAKHGLLTTDAVARWLLYRDNRNDTAHDYGENFAETTLALLPQFIYDARALSAILAKSV